jgi:hypothetical protein
MIKKKIFSILKPVLKMILPILLIFLNILYVNSHSYYLTSSVPESYNSTYNILPITLFLLIFYIISYVLYDNKNISRFTYKRIWTLLLVFSFIVTGVSGLILSIFSDFNIYKQFNFNLIFWHVELGIIFVITLIFHIHIHLKTITKFFKV